MTDPSMRRLRFVRQNERDVLEHAVRAVAEQATKADELIDEALGAGLDGSHPLTVHARCSVSSS